tara:strand:- start:226 stop:468 length:243 start_codon:yes stop_codon:yes gene_type:complete
MKHHLAPARMSPHVRRVLPRLRAQRRLLTSLRPRQVHQHEGTRAEGEEIGEQAEQANARLARRSAGERRARLRGGLGAWM